MAKVYLLEDSLQELSYGFFCKGCDNFHYFRIRTGTFTRDNPLRPSNIPLWTWNNDFEKPTVFPSIYCNPSTPSLTCHSWIKDGNIEYLNDCYHDLKGKTVPMEDDD